MCFESGYGIRLAMLAFDSDAAISVRYLFFYVFTILKAYGYMHTIYAA